MQQKNNIPSYFILSYDLVKEGLITKKTSSNIRYLISAILVLNECKEIKSYVNTTLHFKANKRIDYLYDELENAVGAYVNFTINRIAINKQHKKIDKLFYSKHYQKNYKKKLETHYDLIINRLSSLSYQDLRKLIHKLMAIK